MQLLRVSCLSALLTSSVLAVPLKTRTTNCRTSHNYNTDAVPEGCSGYTKHGDEVIMYYGDDLPNHAAHLAWHYSLYPAHNKAYDILPTGTHSNRNAALDAEVQQARTSGYQLDEKMPNTFDYTGPVTVCLLPESEGQSEGGMLTQVAKICRDSRNDPNRQTPYKARLVDHRSQAAKKPFAQVLAGKVVRKDKDVYKKGQLGTPGGDRPSDNTRSKNPMDASTSPSSSTTVGNKAAPGSKEIPADGRKSPTDGRKASAKDKTTAAKTHGDTTAAKAHGDTAAAKTKGKTTPVKAHGDTTATKTKDKTTPVKTEGKATPPTTKGKTVPASKTHNKTSGKAKAKST